MKKRPDPAAWPLADRAVWAVCAVFAVFAAASPGATQAAGPADPLQASADVPLAHAPAPFAQYRPHTSVTVQPAAWRAANEQVNRVGGWRTYAREAQAPAPAPGGAASSPPPAAHKH